MHLKEYKNTFAFHITPEPFFQLRTCFSSILRCTEMLAIEDKDTELASLDKDKLCFEKKNV
jgi:hypothetical protein